ncbi:MAG: hypothetical protein ACKOKG_10950, partial [Verrucomicrobiota bacterium]
KRNSPDGNGWVEEISAETVAGIVAMDAGAMFGAIDTETGHWNPAFQRGSTGCDCPIPTPPLQSGEPTPTRVTDGS